MGGNIRDLRPDNHTVLVTQIVKVRIVLIMCQTDGICTHLIDQLHILSVMLRQKGVSHAPSVLMARYPAERIRLSI